MSDTVDDFKNYFKSDKVKIRFNVNQSIEKSLKLLAGSINDPKLKISINKIDNPEVYGRQNELMQVIIAIILNARDALAENKTTDPRVTLSVSTVDGRAVITVNDNAGGIPAEIMSRIFDPYFTTKEPSKGTGVGLSMSKNIIENSMGGSIAVRNSADGAEFRIIL